MPEEEKDKLASEIFMGQFLFAKAAPSAFCGEMPEKDEIVKFIMKESIMWKKCNLSEAMIMLI